MNAPIPQPCMPGRTLRSLAHTTLLLLLPVALSAAPQFSLFDVWTPENEELDGDLTNGPEPHFVYGIGITSDDTVLVACEGRFSHSGDGGAKLLLVKRSTDHGATWSSDIVIEGGDGASWTNPAFVVDGVTTYLFYASTYSGTKTLHYKTSTDNGVTWSARQDVTGLWGDPFPNGWVQHGTIGHGIKKLKPPHRGRLVLAFHHRTDNSTDAALAKYGIDLLYHDPAGSWAHAGGVQPPIDLARGPNESRVAERSDGSVVIIARRRWGTTPAPGDPVVEPVKTRTRIAGTSIAGGFDWASWVDADGIGGTKFVDGGFIRFSDTCHLYSFPTVPGSDALRLDLGVAASANGGITWGAPKLIYSGPSTYSDLARDSRGNIYCVFGRDGDNGNRGANARVTVARFNLEWLTGVATPTILIDNGDAGFSTTGDWTASASVPGYLGSGYATTSVDAATATWTPTITVPGNYEVYLRWTAYGNRPDAAPVQIKYNGGGSTAATTVNQKTEGGTWYYLGTYPLAAGTGNSVTISASDPGSCVADAVMFQKQ